MKSDFEILDKFHENGYINSKEYYIIKLRIIEYYKRLEKVKQELREEVK